VSPQNSDSNKQELAIMSPVISTKSIVAADGSTVLSRIGRVALAQVIVVTIILVAGWNLWPSLIAWASTQHFELHAPDFAPIIKLPTQSLLHIGGAMTSLVLGPVILWAPKGTANHKTMGRVWALAMASTCVSSFFMGSFMPMLGQFGPIHLLSVWVSIQLPRGILLARAGKIAQHLSVMRGMYVGLVVSGLMTFMPGRTLFMMFFG
jgi:uncharacterized membrane protein